MTRTGILVVIGTRPEAIKLAPVIRQLRSSSAAGAILLCVSGHHLARVKEQLRDLGLSADVACNAIAHPVDLPRLLGQLTDQLRAVVESIRPRLVVVQGDTATTLAAALAALHCRIQVAHVEAGLRTGNVAAPFPEETYRRTIATIARLHFAPTLLAAENLRAEGVAADTVYVTGNTIVDAFYDRIRRSDGVRHAPRRRVLVSLHRRESLGPCLESMFGALPALADEHPTYEFVCHINDNPAVAQAFETARSGCTARNLTSIGSLSHSEFLEVLGTSRFVMTDSGGVQEEAPLLGRPVLILRNETDRPEGVAAGGAKLVGTSVDAILDAARQLICDNAVYERMARVHSPFGDGHAAVRIATTIARHIVEEAVE
jgi:UDP-N-acetylglucosamine 2-epimerase (non-hydrolysing)